MLQALLIAPAGSTISQGHTDRSDGRTLREPLAELPAGVQHRNRTSLSRRREALEALHLAGGVVNEAEGNFACADVDPDGA